MGFNIVLLKLLCDRYVIPKLVSVKVQGKVMYFTKETYGILTDRNRKELSIFESNKISIGDEVIKMFKKFYLRPSKKVYKELVMYVQSELDKDMLSVIYHNGVIAVMDTLHNSTKSVMGSLISKK